MVSSAQGNGVSKERLCEEFSVHFDSHLFRLRAKLARVGAEIRFELPGRFVLRVASEWGGV
jgi:hypothetical protein